MAGNRRGKLKEHFEGIHRNIEWIKDHVAKIIALVGNDNPSLSKGAEGIGEAMTTIDDVTNDLYSSL